MASNVRSFIGSYLIRDGEKTVGCTVKSTVVDGVRNGRIIGFNINPSVDDYFKIIQLSGDLSLDGMIIPDTSLLVKIDDFFKGQFVGIEIKREVRLRKHYTVNRNGKTVQIFSMDRVQYDKINYNKLDLNSLKTFVGGDAWEPASRPSSVKENMKDKQDKKIGSSKNGLSTVKKAISVTTDKKRVAISFKESEEKKLYEKIDATGKTKLLEETGDLFSIEDGLIVNCISADVHMGAGIAKDFNSNFPLDKDILIVKKPKVGVTYIIKDDNSVVRGYLVTKDLYYSKPTEETMRSCLKSLFRQCIKMGFNDVFMPRIGCGLDKMKWEDVRKWIEEYISDKNLKVTVLHLSNEVVVNKEMIVDVLNQCDLAENDQIVEEEIINGTESELEDKKGEKSFLLCEWKTSDQLKCTNKIAFELDLTNRIDSYIDPELVDIVGYREVHLLENIIFTSFNSRFSCILEVETDNSYLIMLKDEMTFNVKATATDSDGIEHEVGLSLVG